MKILWLTAFPHPEKKVGHAGSWITSLADELSKRSDISLIILYYDRDQKQKLRKFKLKDNLELCYIKVPSAYLNLLSFNYLYIYILRKAIEKYFPDVDAIHVHGTEYQFHVVSRGIAKPFVVSIQGVIYKCIHYININFSFHYLSWKIAKYHEKKYIPGIPFFSCRTRWDSQLIKELNPDAKIFMIWEMIRKEFYSYAYKQASRDIFYVGGSNPIKGFEFMLKAFNLVKAHIDLKLYIAGHCTYQEIGNIVKRQNLNYLDIRNDIILMGYLKPNEMITQFEKSMCLVHPSYIDNSPNSVCEAQLCGIPVIASNVGGLESLIENNKTGILVDLDSKLIAEKILYLYHHPETRKIISENSHKMALQRHDKLFIINKVIDMYRHIIMHHKLDSKSF